MSNISERLAQLRRAMAEAHLQAWIVPSSDPHQSEYVAAHWEARAWFSGFTGSAGTLVVTLDKAALWTDSRYYLQAEQQLPAGVVTLMRSQDPETPSTIEWLASELKKDDLVGIDGRLVSVSEAKSIRQECADAGLKLVSSHDIVAAAWEGRPELPKAPIFEHEVRFAGRSRGEKLGQIREKMKAGQVQYHLLCSLDDIAWLLNLRGSDVRCNPTFYAYCLVGLESVCLFIALDKVPVEVRASLEQDGVVLRPYESLVADLLALEGSILIDPATTSLYLQESLPSHLKVKTGMALTTFPKAMKNEVEVAHLRATMAKDGAALFRLYRWLLDHLRDGITEAEVSDQIRAFRSEQPLYHDESFDPIVGYAGNGAIVHYRPVHGNCATLAPAGLLLMDSGGQYQDGTTDITRTFALGEATAAQRRNNTLVLKGHIALAMAQCPYGTGGHGLDALVRMPLWRHGLDFGHGTGHGVGFFLNVHEGPQGIHKVATGRALTRFEPGMLTSNEPGYYEAGEYGIRIENLILCVEAESGPKGRFLRFETMSLFPIDLELVEDGLLNTEERSWLNDYHMRVKAALSPLLNEDERAHLAKLCRSI